MADKENREFFLPDLCQAQSILLLVLVTLRVVSLLQGCSRSRQGRSGLRLIPWSNFRAIAGGARPTREQLWASSTATSTPL